MKSSRGSRRFCSHTQRRLTSLDETCMMIVPSKHSERCAPLPMERGRCRSDRWAPPEQSFPVDPVRYLGIITSRGGPYDESEARDHDPGTAYFPDHVRG